MRHRVAWFEGIKALEDSVSPSWGFKSSNLALKMKESQSFKTLEALMQCHSFTSKMTWIFSNTVLKTSHLAQCIPVKYWHLPVILHIWNDPPDYILTPTNPECILAPTHQPIHWHIPTRLHIRTYPLAYTLVHPNPDYILTPTYPTTY
jgi:hypothetical protein